MRGTRVEIAERDLKIFELIKRMGWVRQDDIAYYLGLDYRDKKVNQIMRNIGFRLQKHGYIIKKRFLVGYPSYWCFTKLGAGFYNGIAEPRFVLQNMKHDGFVSRLLIQILQKNTLDVKTEFELKHEIVFDKKNNKKKKIKIPDLLVGNTAIEVELTQKNLTRIYDIIREYEYGEYDKVTYYTTHAIANIMSNITKTNDKFQYKIINENDIINSIEFVNPKYPIKEKILNEKQKLREMLGLT
tara:strand:+ start:169 stop:894 length:726 start_codon:yes stop_codon:yes gene_type:complete